MLRKIGIKFLIMNLHTNSKLIDEFIIDFNVIEFDDEMEIVGPAIL